MSVDLPVFPPGAECSQIQDKHTCPITPDMISFLNLSTGFHEYFPGYCLSPPSDDGCPYGFCPNPDIAGPLVRISAYLTNMFVAILIFHNHEELQESFWSQILTVYSLLITCGVSIIQRQLTRIHAILATALAGSPLSLYILVYTIRSTWGDANRLVHVIGPGHIIPRTIVLIAFVIWVALIIYIMLPTHLSYFTQFSCEQRSDQVLIKYFFFLPIVLFVSGLTPLGQWILSLPLQIAIFSWIVAIWLRRREIWPRGEKYSPRIWTVWRVVNVNYPFVRFTSIVFMPFVYWVSIIETGTFASNDDRFTATFGQVLAMFVTLPPMIQVLMLAPRCGRWFIDLTWVRFVTFRHGKQQSRVSSVNVSLVLTDTPLGRYDDDTKMDPLLEPDEDHKV